jgi:glycosyltransferase involved in cell wall biosynthesis
LRDHVTFHGKVDHDRVLHLLRNADVFCFPTSSEGFPKVVVEALACGLPVVTTRVSVLPELVAGCGILLEKHSAIAIAKAVNSCLSDPKQYRVMSLKAAEKAWSYSLECWRDTIGQMLRGAWGPLKTSS